jgi:excisionase family DNA binding protein
MRKDRQAPANPDRRIMNIRQLCDYLDCHPSTIYRMLKRREIPAFKLGSDWRFHRESIDRWCMERESEHMRAR